MGQSLTDWFNNVLIPALASAPGGPIRVDAAKPEAPQERLIGEAVALEAVELCAREPSFQLKVGPFDLCLFIGR